MVALAIGTTSCGGDDKDEPTDPETKYEKVTNVEATFSYEFSDNYDTYFKKYIEYKDFDGNTQRIEVTGTKGSVTTKLATPTTAKSETEAYVVLEDV